MTQRVPVVVCHYCCLVCDWSESSKFIYGTDYGPVWFCPRCDAWVGCVGESKRALGTPANAEDRRLRKEAHAVLDPLWQQVAERDEIPQSLARSRAYKWLSDTMGISLVNCHIGVFHGPELLRVIEICTPPYGEE